jgi:hypothetical protein
MASAEGGGGLSFAAWGSGAGVGSGYSAGVGSGYSAGVGSGSAASAGGEIASITSGSSSFDGDEISGVEDESDAGAVVSTSSANILLARGRARRRSARPC